MEKKPRSGMAVTSLVLGIVALVTSVLPFINNLSFVMAILGLIFGIVGMVGIAKGKKDGKGLAIAGIILSVIACIVVLAAQATWSAAFDKAMDEAGYSSSSSAAAVSQSAEQGSEGAAADAGSAPAPEQAEGAGQEAPASDYAVTIDGCRVAEDYAGDPVAVVTYTFTNNSDKATSFMVALRPQVFQNGVELNTAIGSDWDSEKYMSDVKPGSSSTVEIGYSLEDKSDLTVEVTELISFNDTVLAESTFSLK